MPGVDIANLRAWWTSGYLVIGDTAGNAVVTINPSTGGVLFGNGSGITISTGGIKVSNEKSNTITTTATLTATSSGTVNYVTASDVIITLPGAGSSGKPLLYTIVNACTSAGQIVVLTCTGEKIIGCLGSSAGVDIMANTAATHVYGDRITILNTPASTSWATVGMIGTWVSTT
jgi:hypothetical protein